MSLFNKTWKMHEPAPREFLDEFGDLSPVLAQILWNRGLRGKQEINSFLSPDYDKDLHDPFLLKDMSKAVERIYKAIRGGEKIYIYGDYDADGVCASTILKEGLEKLGADDVPVYIPHREKDGYGMNIDAVDKILKEGAQLIITVDCGSTNVAEVRHAEDSGIDVIITDHHQVLEEKRFSYALVNPHQKGDKYPFKGICGAVVAFKLVRALSLHIEGEEGSSPLGDGRDKWLLDLAAMATVADVMPLVDENRTIVKYGLLVLAKTRRPGLKALMDIARIRPENLDAFHLGFVIGPRINAAGRMDHANLAFDLLDARAVPVARRLAGQLDKKNKDRQRLVAEIVAEIDTASFADAPAIFDGRPHWPIGVLGIVAGRLAEEYNKPSFIYQKQEAKLVGSARTPEYANTVDILRSSSHALVKFGGHAQAGGFTAEPHMEAELKSGIADTVEDRVKDMKPEDLQPFIRIDAEVAAGDINWKLYKSTASCGPFGEGNPKPLFLLKGAALSGARMVGERANHLKCDIVAENKSFSAIGFRFGDAVEHISDSEKVDVVFELDKNEWNGREELQLKLVDINTC